MKPFETLIRRVKRDLTRPGTSLTTFPSVATRILEDFEYPWTKDQLDAALSDWFLKSGELPEQAEIVVKVREWIVKNVLYQFEIDLVLR